MVCTAARMGLVWCNSSRILLALLLLIQRWSCVSSSGSLRALQEEQDRSLQQLPPLRQVVSSFGKPLAPLQKCDGDCDFDYECEGGLKCFHRVGFETVPGCQGVGSVSGMDVCYDEEDENVGNGFIPLAKAEAEPQMMQQQTLSTSAVASTEIASTEVSVVNGFFSTPSTGSLGKCEGDCNWHSECAPGLRCFYRSANENVPGCYGISQSHFSMDFCYDPADVNNNVVGGDSIVVMISAEPLVDSAAPPPPVPQPVPAPVPQPQLNPATSPGNLPLVYSNGVGTTPLGDCDDDTECEGDLICFQRNGDENVPGCSGEDIGFRTGVDFCVRRFQDPPAFTAPPPELLQVTENDVSDMTPGTPFLEIVGDNNVSNLARCEGDCDDDGDCFGDFVCYQRTSPFSYIPGCFGDGDGPRDYCIDPADNPRNIHRDSFKLKLFWRSGYLWQEETIERKWCIECAGTRCNVGDELVISRCNNSGDNEFFHFVHREGEEISIQVAGTNLCFESPADRITMRLQPCDSWRPEQRFRPGLGGWDWDRFELQPVAAPGCITQRHHPKEAEPLYREDCVTAREDRTSFWNKYV